MTSCLCSSITGFCYSQCPLDGRSVPYLYDSSQNKAALHHLAEDIFRNPDHFQTQNILFEALFLTDIHYPTAYLLAHSKCHEQEALALHYFTVHHNSRSKTTKSLQNSSQKYRRQPASQNIKTTSILSESHWLHGDNCTKKQFIPRIYQH